MDIHQRMRIMIRNNARIQSVIYALVIWTILYVLVYISNLVSDKVHAVSILTIVMILIEYGYFKYSFKKALIKKIQFYRESEKKKDQEKAILLQADCDETLFALYKVLDGNYNVL